MSGMSSNKQASNVSPVIIYKSPHIFPSSSPFCTAALVLIHPTHSLTHSLIRHGPRMYRYLPCKIYIHLSRVYLHYHTKPHCTDMYIHPPTHL